MLLKKSVQTLLASILGFTTVGCSSLLYYPSRHKYVDPAKLDPGPHEFRLENKRQEKLVGWQFKSKIEEKTDYVIIQFHGNGENLSSHFASIYWVLNFGVDYVIFDYPGYGGSEGVPSPKTTVEAGEIFVRWVHKQYPKKKIAILGQSLGGAVALRTALNLKDQVPICAVIAESTFPSYQKVGAWVLAQQWWTWLFQPLAYILLSDSYAPHGDIGKISPIPLIVIHGNKDHQVGFELGRQVFEQGKDPKEFWEIKDAGHIQAFNSNRKENRIRLMDTLGRFCK